MDEELSQVGPECPVCGETFAEPWLSAPDRFHGGRSPFQLLRCRACTLVWTHDAPPPKEIGRFYGHDYDSALSRAGADASHWRSRCEAVRAYKQGGALLDLGCSTGGFLNAMKGPSWTLHGIEMSADTARHAEATAGASVFVGGVLDAPFSPHSFDVITCFHVLEHLYQPKEVMDRVASWLKPGGIFFLMVPNIDSAGARMFGSYWYALELPRHLFHYSPESLRRLTAGAGLETLSLTTHRELFVEKSIRYVVDGAAARVGLARRPLSQSEPPSLVWRVLRKGLYLTTAPFVNGAARLMGSGESIHGLFVKTA